jgi:hypothetical protein
MSIGGFEGLRLPDLSIRAGLDTLTTRNTLVDEDPCSGHRPRSENGSKFRSREPTGCRALNFESMTVANLK